MTTNIITSDPAVEITEITETNGQIASSAYWYKVNFVLNEIEHEEHVTVIAVNSSSARGALSQQFVNATVSFLGCSRIIMQVNG